MCIGCIVRSYIYSSSVSLGVNDDLRVDYMLLKTGIHFRRCTTLEKTEWLLSKIYSVFIFVSPKVDN